jgi:hypothetical protein
MATSLETGKDLSLVQLLFGGLIMIGLLIKWLSSLLTKTDSPLGEATATIWGYSIILFSLLGLVIIQLDSNNNPITQISKIPVSIFGLFVIVIWIIILNVIYGKYINRKTIPPTYYFWNAWSTVFIALITILILIQYYASLASNVGSILNTTIFNKDNLRTLNVYLGFILFLNILITGIQTTILNNFRVDG